MNRFKQICCFVIVFIQIILCSCSKTQNVEHPKETKPKQIEILENAIFEATDGSPDGEGYTTFDSGCAALDQTVEYITDIIKAEYSSSKIFKTGHIHIFNVIESLRGDSIEKEIYVFERIDHISCHEYENNYKKGERYLLLLQRSSDPFVSFDTFKSVHSSLVIPLDATGAPDISKSKICNGEMIDKIEDDGLKLACSEGRLISYLQQITKDNPYKKTYKGFTETYDKNFAIQDAEYVIKISVDANPYKTKSAFLPPHIISVGVSVEKPNILKGDPSVLPEYINVYLPATIESGNYIVAINNTAYYNPNGKYIPSTRNSIYPIDEESEIVKIINHTVN